MTDAERAFRDRVGAQLDAVIRQQIGDLWLQLEADRSATTAAPDPERLDLPVPPGLTWQRLTVAEIVQQETTRLQAWKLSAIDQAVEFAKELRAAQGRR